MYYPFMRRATSPTSLQAFLIAILAAMAQLACDDTPKPEDPPEQWVILKRINGTIASYDSSRVTHEPTGFVVWLRYDLVAPSVYPDSAHTQVSHMEVESHLDCAAQQSQDMTLRLYGKQDAVIKDTSLAGSPWQPFEKSSHGAQVLKPLCKHLSR